MIFNYFHVFNNTETISQVYNKCRHEMQENNSTKPGKGATEVHCRKILLLCAKSGGRAQNSTINTIHPKITTWTHSKASTKQIKWHHVQHRRRQVWYSSMVVEGQACRSSQPIASICPGNEKKVIRGGRAFRSSPTTWL